MTPAASRLSAALDVTLRGAKRLERSALHERVVLDAAIGAEDEDEDSALVVDAFVQRYQQMVEHMLRRLYPAIYRLMQSGDRPPLLLDLLAALEGAGVLPDEHAWVVRKELRDTLIHEYPLDGQRRAAVLRAAADEASGILSDLQEAQRMIEARGFLEVGNDPENA